jgi:tetratricopeptide (TPR) repeat protein
MNRFANRLLSRLRRATNFTTRDALQAHSAYPPISTGAAGDLMVARAAFHDGDARAALLRLIPIFEADASFTPAYALASDCLRALGGDAEAALFQAAAAHLQDSRPLYELGRHFVDADRERLAIPFLERALALAPGDPNVALQLAAALTAERQPQRARDVLENVDRSSGSVAHQYYWSTLLTGRSDGVHEFVSDGRQALEQDADRLGAYAVKLYSARLDELDDCATRFERIDHPQARVRDWQYIQYGAAILDEWECMEVAGGRYVMQCATYTQVATILHRLRQTLTALNHYPVCVLGLADRDSEITARAAAEVLGVPYAPATQSLVGTPGALIIVGDAQSTMYVEELRVAQPNQTLFALNLQWTSGAEITPDIAGLLSQTFFPPWGAQLKLNPTSKGLEQTVPDNRPAYEVAAEVAATRPLVSSRFDEVLDFLVQHAVFLKAGRAGSRRSHFRKDSPIPGAAFM